MIVCGGESVLQLKVMNKASSQKLKSIIFPSFPSILIKNRPFARSDYTRYRKQSLLAIASIHFGRISMFSMASRSPSSMSRAQRALASCNSGLSIKLNRRDLRAGLDGERVFCRVIAMGTTLLQNRLEINCISVCSFKVKNSTNKMRILMFSDSQDYTKGRMIHSNKTYLPGRTLVVRSRWTLCSMKA